MPVFAGPYVPEIAVRVIVDELALREDASVDSPLVAVLARDDVIVLHGLPFQADGFAWYSATKVGTGGTLPTLPAPPVNVEPPIGGFVPVGTATVDNVAPVPERCPTTVDLEHVSAMLDSERLACFGKEPIELQGVYGCGGCGGEGSASYEPAWLGNPLSSSLLSVNPAARRGPLIVRFPPGGSEPPADGSMIKVRGHFDDPLAQTCVITDLVDDFRLAVEPFIAIGICRHSFVAESWEPSSVEFIPPPD